ncbi:MAG: biotin transporter BioY [Gemmatimonadota bacterium]|jgi:biotin transport system substrate-specific component
MTSTSGRIPGAPAGPAILDAAAPFPVRLAALALAAGLTALSARVAVPLPGVAVPFTLQPVAVLLSGLLLGARGGMLAQLAYLGAGVAGLPVFAAGGGAAYLLGPTGGYLLAFPLAAGAAGAVAGRSGGVVRVLVGGIAAIGVLHAGGLAWIAVLAGTDAAREVGLARFALGDLLKVALVTLIAVGPGGRIRRLLA